MSLIVSELGTQTLKPRTAGPLSRRERVESLVLRAASSHGVTNSSESDDSASPSPVSETSSSPEPFDTPCIVDPTDHGGSHRRSLSLSRLQIPGAHDPYPFSRTYFIEPTSCVSSPGLGPLRTSRRSSLTRNRSYSPSPSITSPECGYELEYGDANAPFSSLPPQSSSLSLPELLTLSECFALQDTDSSVSRRVITV